MATIQELTDYYKEKLIAQYRFQPNATNTIALYAKQILVDGIPLQVNPAFDLETADGVQLDVIGKYVGVSRYIGDLSSKPYFGFVRYTPVLPENPNGFRLYGDPDVNITGIFYQYSFDGQDETALTDASYRSVIKLKIVLNASDNTLYSIQIYLEEFFPDLISVVDNADMSLTYTVSSDVPLSESVLLAYLPKPMGVKINVEGISIFRRILSSGETRILETGETRLVEIPS